MLDRHACVRDKCDKLESDDRCRVFSTEPRNRPNLMTDQPKPPELV